MQKRYINIIFSYLLFIPLNFIFITSSKAIATKAVIETELELGKKTIQQISALNKNIQQFNNNFQQFNSNIPVNTVRVCAAVTTCLAAKKMMDNNSDNKDQTFAIGVFISSIVFQIIIQYRKEIVNFIFKSNPTP